ncbi:unnamed protein product [Gemmata massiliana]|uniref:Uncharacterized protein n=1 Tax=Gemmata massiliana TaxID=1210884 RepID=A0A6P2CX96_9BACT|nr:hypothetical protein [Gemmata massiliana]VTR93207.1 unnamed protein product [Gemmata massiliana]
MGYLSGKTGYVQLGSTTYSFGKWKLSMKAGTPKITNWTTNGFQAVVPGVVAATISCSGPWNFGRTPVTLNSVYAFHLGLDTGVELVVNAQVSAIEPENDVEGTPAVSITAESTGTFTASIS